MDIHDIETEDGYGNSGQIGVPLYLRDGNHMVWQTTVDGVQKYVAVHQLLAISEGYSPYDVFDGSTGNFEVHHINEISWDNRPENIEMLTPEEHGHSHDYGQKVAERRRLRASDSSVN